MKTLESIFSEIKESGVITKQQLQVLKNRSNKQQKDVIDYDLGEKYPSMKISLVNGDVLNVWGYTAKEFMNLINE